jgi:NADH-quinone oxidoreductase subunit N
MKLFLLLIALVINTYLPTILNSISTNISELPLLLLISTTLTILLVSSQNYAMLLLALESLSLVLYILTAVDRLHGGIIAAVKYFIFGTLGSVLLFWGAAQLYSIIPSLGFRSQYFANEITFWYCIPGVSNSIMFAGLPIVVGFLIKLGAAPFHYWVPDVYAGSPMVITAYFSTVIKLIIFMLLGCFSYRVSVGTLIDMFSLCSLLVGGILTLRQIEIKRFLAYSSITHVGFLLSGDLTASFIYIITYICSSLLFFSVVLALGSYDKELIYLSDLRFIKRKNKLQSAALVVSLASMAGLPPFSGFFGKLLI